MGILMGNYITIKQACEYYNVTRKTIYNWRNSGAIKESNKGGTVLLEVDSIEAMITRKLPINSSQDLMELTQEIHKLNAKIDQLEVLITQLLPISKGNVTQELPTSKGSVTQELPTSKGSVTQELPNSVVGEGKNTQDSHYKKRTQETIEKARRKFIELGMPNITKKELAERSGVSRGAVQKYWDRITQSVDV